VHARLRPTSELTYLSRRREPVRYLSRHLGRLESSRYSIRQIPQRHVPCVSHSRMIHHIPRHISTHPYRQGDTASFTFTGTGVYLFGALKVNHDEFTVIINDTISVTGNSFSDPFQFQQTLFGLGDLPYGTHRVVLENTCDLAAPYVDLDFIIITTGDGEERFVGPSSHEPVLRSLLVRRPSIHPSIAPTWRSCIAETRLATSRALGA
jgi:hypothetical protein